MDLQWFDELVFDVFDFILFELVDVMDNVVVLVVNCYFQYENLFGQYEGVVLIECGFDYVGLLFDVIMIYCEVLLDVCDFEDEVVDQVVIMVIYEVVYYFGIDDECLD